MEMLESTFFTMACPLVKWLRFDVATLCAEKFSQAVEVGSRFEMIEAQRFMMNKGLPMPIHNLNARQR